MCSYLDERMPVCDGFAWVSQHFIPVFSSQTLSIITYSTHANDLIVTYTVKRDSKILCLLCKTTSCRNVTLKKMKQKTLPVVGGFHTWHICCGPMCDCHFTLTGFYRKLVHLHPSYIITNVHHDMKQNTGQYIYLFFIIIIFFCLH